MGFVPWRTTRRAHLHALALCLIFIINNTLWHKMLGSTQTWLGAVAWVGLAELVTFAIYTPAYRHDWRDWARISWRAEWPFMYPPVMLAGGLWFVLQLVNGLGAFFVWRVDVAEYEYYVALALWLAALGVYSLWAIPWEMELPPWTLVCWTLSWVLSVGACAFAYNVDGAIVGAGLMSVYVALVGLLLVVNWAVLLSRTFSSGTEQVLHQRWFNPFTTYGRNDGWPIRQVPVDGGWRRIDGPAVYDIGS